MLRYHCLNQHLTDPMAAQPTPLPRPLIAPAAEAHGRTQRVLVVDDHPPIRDWVRMILAPHGFETHEARSGEAAIELVRQGTSIDVAICDVLMPHAELEGIAAARVLWYEHGVPCLILTSVQEAGSRLAAAYADAVGYVLKDAAGIARRRRGPRRAPLPDWDRDKLLQLVKVKGLPYARAFARRNHVSREKLAVLLGRPRLARGPADRQVLVEHDDAIRAAHERGVPIKSLATHYGSTVRAISYSLDRTSRKQPETRTEDAVLASGCFPIQE